jgi:hypothetical protein
MERIWLINQCLFSFSSSVWQMDDKQKKICAMDSSSIKSLMKSNCWKGDCGFVCYHNTNILTHMSSCQSV